MIEPVRTAAVLPCYRVRDRICDVLARIGPEVFRIYVVDDACPEHTGDHVAQSNTDPRVTVLRHATNKGVGGAVMTGYRQAVADGADIVVKIDGDGQMDPAMVPRFVAPIADGRADYTKGNRFYRLTGLANMPPWRIIGNAVLSFMIKLSSGYWTIFDPTNGYTAISTRVIDELELEKVSCGYFFESDMLFRLGILRAKVVDIPMEATYEGERSGLRVARVIGPFLLGYTRNGLKRLFYNYFLRDFSVASLQLVFGVASLLFGFLVGVRAWALSISSGVPSTTGTVMLSALPVFLGIQLLLAFISYDVASSPTSAIHPLLREPETERALTSDVEPAGAAIRNAVSRSTG